MWRGFVRTSVQQARVAALNLTRHRRRTLLALAIICGGVVSFLLAGGFINWVLWGMREGVIQSQLGHVQITRPGYFRDGTSDPYRFLLGNDLSIIRPAPPFDIRTVAPRLAFTGLVSINDATISFVGEGVDPKAEIPLSGGITVLSGSDLAAAGADSATLGEGLAANVGARPGDAVVLMATTASGSVNAVEVTVAGTFATPVKAYDDTAIRVPIEVARRLMRVEGATSWVVLLDETEHTDAAVAAFRAALPTDRFEVVPWSELADFYNKTVELFGTQVNAVLLLIAVIVALSISNTLSMAVIERTTEIGTSMALGVRRLGILTLFIWEGVVLGLVAGVVGVGIALLLGEIISLVGIPMPPPPGMSQGYTGRIDISTALALQGFFLAFITTVIASILPAWKASRMNIVDALRHQT
ncbi:FtsX-like permease family protein [Thauera sp.]|jgi:putative ABC transport system permease protein|uniref:ABC transporter permease n=1 Tax=Thauera sp. TaxID=1905334 RepID=UPI002613663F|nr:FtsX-like permease family protein [Thauera sp.]MCK6408556.1 FtsX-like permease family protein [Thauera sp.]